MTRFEVGKKVQLRVPFTILSIESAYVNVHTELGEFILPKDLAVLQCAKVGDVFDGSCISAVLTILFAAYPIDSSHKIVILNNYGCRVDRPRLSTTILYLGLVLIDKVEFMVNLKNYEV